MNRIFTKQLGRMQQGTRHLMLSTVLSGLFLAAAPQAYGEDSYGDIEPSKAGLPFKAVFTTALSVKVDPKRCPDIVQVNEGDGLGTQIGKFKVYQTSCLTPSTDPLTFRDGRFVFTAADGSTLRGYYGGRVVPTPTTLQDDQLLLDAAWSISGGTGRFIGAKGGGSGSGLLSPGAGDARIVLDGRISLPEKH
ncbi:hypothetical protein [Methylomicrobium lacus]|uniref:hypothetical protein n=1 Tax=Methylomicrobium lacus TaxID=136992 RepID=UPI0035A89BD0